MSEPQPARAAMNVVKLRLSFTGNRRKDLGFGVAAGVASWGLGWVVFRLANPRLGLPHRTPWQGFGWAHVLTGCALFFLFAAIAVQLSRRPYARHFLFTLVLTAAAVPPLAGWVLVVLRLYLHG